MTISMSRKKGIIPDLFDEFFGEADGLTNSFFGHSKISSQVFPGGISLRLYDEVTGYDLELVVPGVAKKDIKIYAYGQVLTIEYTDRFGECKTETITLSDDADMFAAWASLSDGLLHVIVPLRKTDAKPPRITIPLQ